MRRRYGHAKTELRSNEKTRGEGQGEEGREKDACVQPIGFFKHPSPVDGANSILDWPIEC